MLCVRASSLSTTSATSNEKFTVWIGAATYSECLSPFYVDPSCFRFWCLIKINTSFNKSFTYLYDIKILVSVCNLQLGEMVRRKARIFGSVYLKMGLIYRMCPKSCPVPILFWDGKMMSSLLAGHHLQGNHGRMLDWERQNLSGRRVCRDYSRDSGEPLLMSRPWKLPFLWLTIEWSDWSCGTDFYKH